MGFKALDAQLAYVRGMRYSNYSCGYCREPSSMHKSDRRAGKGGSACRCSRENGRVLTYNSSTSELVEAVPQALHALISCSVRKSHDVHDVRGAGIKTLWFQKGSSTYKFGMIRLSPRLSNPKS